MNKITITRALNALKLLDKRIKKTITSNAFLGFTVNDKQQVQNFNPESSMQSIRDMIKTRADIKSAIMQSNTVTNVVIAGETMTVIQAIETKSTIEYRIKLLDQLKAGRTAVRAAIERTNHSTQNRLDTLLESHFGKDSKSKESEMEVITKPFLIRNEAIETNPIKIDETIKGLEEYIDNFISEVDFILSESNATTFIEV